MTLQVDRFVKKEIKGGTKQVAFTKKTAVLIWDHKNDEIIGYLNLYGNLDENEELADKIIETIENHILEAEDGSSE